MWEYMTGVKIEGSKILHLSKNYDKFEVFNVKSLSQAWKAFKSICYLYDDIHKNKNKKIEKDVKRISI
jgi:hypothetical protein